ncbi:MULE domain-containing protein [Aphis craccivora]|uniref:MULE domain-containing protein n=1 Tax=Aphis craccivora TaxID=307492 RepID=A0A6G0YQK9_APHCR|nr:MULE domain-containing protein [Aphis craccivora]
MITCSSRCNAYSSSLHHLKHTIRRVRTRNQCSPPIPKTVSDLKIADEYTKTIKGEQFLIFDSGALQDRILIIEINPTSVTMDIEHVLINAFKIVFPRAKQQGYFFHFSKSIWRQIQNVGLVENYINNSNFALHIRILAALAYVPPDNVINAYEEIVETQFYVENEHLLMPFLDYFEDNWNTYSLGASHPNIWKFIDGIKKVQNIEELKREQYNTGEQPQKKKYKDCN